MDLLTFLTTEEIIHSNSMGRRIIACGIVRVNGRIITNNSWKNLNLSQIDLVPRFDPSFYIKLKKGDVVQVGHIEYIV